MTPRISIQRFTTIQTQMYIFICHQSEKQTIFQVREVIKKHGYQFIVCRSFEPSSSIDNPLYGQPSFIVFSKTPLWKCCPNEIQDKHTKNSQDKVISSKQHYISFISETFISNTG